MSSLWLSIEPLPSMTRLLLSESGGGPALKARLPATPSQPRAVAMLLEALVAWYGEPLCAVLDADAEDVQRNPQRWAAILGDLQSPQIEVEWVSPLSMPAVDKRLLGDMGDYRRARRLITLAATGQR
jgi:hypothetical protein